MHKCIFLYLSKPFCDGRVSPTVCGMDLVYDGWTQCAFSSHCLKIAMIIFLIPKPQRNYVANYEGRESVNKINMIMTDSNQLAVWDLQDLMHPLRQKTGVF